MVADAGAGPRPIHHTKLTVSSVSDGIRFCLSPDAQVAARRLSAKMQLETGVETSVSLIEAAVAQDDRQCDLLPNRPAVWTCRFGKHRMKLSAAAAEVLQQTGVISTKDLKLYVSPKLLKHIIQKLENKIN